MADPGTIEFVAWKDITLFHALLKNLKGARDFYASNEASASDDAEIITPRILTLLKDPITFKAKVKLHGSNAGVALSGTEIRAQSRTQFIDKSGFGRIVFDKNEAYWRSLVAPDGPQVFTVYGEYAGPGVQKGVALANLKNVIFAVFGIDIGGRLILEPADIEAFLTQNGKLRLPSDVFVLPWYPVSFELDLSDDTPEKMKEIQAVLDKIDEEVMKVDSNDPWVEAVFGVKGPGEGLVLYPTSLFTVDATYSQYKTIDRNLFGQTAFKAKGEAHRVVAAKKSVTVDPEKAANASAFAELMCPTPRLEQGAATVGGYDMSKIKAFIAWVQADVQKEGKHELEASGLTWNDVLGPISKLASAWYAKETKAKKST